MLPRRQCPATYRQAMPSEPFQARELDESSLRELVAPLISTGFATFEDVRRGGDAPARPVTPLQVVADAVFS